MFFFFFFFVPLLAIFDHLAGVYFHSELTSRQFVVPLLPSLHISAIGEWDPGVYTRIDEDYLIISAISENTRQRDLPISMFTV